MKIQTPLILAALASAQFASAQIFNDAFASGTGAWYKADTTNSTTLSNVSGQLSFNTGSATNMSDAIGRAFTETSLAVGETLRLSFDYRQDSASVELLRVGIFNLTGRTATADDWSGATTPSGSFAGYYGFVRDNDSANFNAIREEANNFNSSGTNNNIGPMMATGGTFTTYSNGINQFDINQDGTVSYKVRFDITRSATNTVNLAYNFMNAAGTTNHFALTATDATSPYTTFDTVVIRPNAGTAYFDNVQLSVIPEPGTALGGLLLTAGMLRRRRNQGRPVFCLACPS
jgi:hypothetical protein